MTISAVFIHTWLHSAEAHAHLEMFAHVTGIAAVIGTGKYEQALMLQKVACESARSFRCRPARAVDITVFVVSVLATNSAP